jgi:hypothetical protein
MDVTRLGLCPMAGFGISSVESSGSHTIVLVASQMSCQTVFLTFEPKQ